jgi:hypothetical protein
MGPALISDELEGLAELSMDANKDATSSISLFFGFCAMTLFTTDSEHIVAAANRSERIFMAVQYRH